MRKIILLTLVILISLSTYIMAEVYMWVDKDGVKNFSTTPPTQSSSKKIEELYSSGSSSGSAKNHSMKNLDLISIEKDWYLSSSSLQKEKIYQPRVQFSIRNKTDKNIERIEINAVFYEGNKIFDRVSEIVYDLPANITSETIFLRPATGFVYNGYNRKTIMSNKFLVKITFEYDGMTESVSMRFASPLTN